MKNIMPFLLVFVLLAMEKTSAQGFISFYKQGVAAYSLSITNIDSIGFIEQGLDSTDLNNKSTIGDQKIFIYDSGKITDSIQISDFDSIAFEITNLVQHKYDSFVDVRDSSTYQTVIIGTQTWMSENLAYLPRQNHPTDTSSVDPKYYVQNIETYGVLYNWPAAKNACPAGWHLPSDAEWNVLVDYLGSNVALKMKSVNGWKNNTNGTNESGFSALPGGFCSFIGFGTVGQYGYWWSSTSIPGMTHGAYARDLGGNNSKLGKMWGYMNYGHSVRCVAN